MAPTRTLVLALLPAFLFLALPAEAGEGESPPPSRFFEAYDGDGNGKVTLEELGGDEEVFRLLDRDGDGVITAEDLGDPSEVRPHGGPPGAGPGGRGGAGRGPGAGPGGRRGRDGRPGEAGGRRGEVRRRLQEMDKDGDGRVSRDEFSGPDPLFDRIDRNGDGYLDPKDRAGEGGPDGRGGRGAPGRPGKPGGPEGRPGAGGRSFAPMDANGDGKVTKDEYTGPVPFERLDRDGDGTLTRKELRAMAPAGGRGGERGARGARGDPRAAFKRLDKDGDGALTAAELARPGAVERLDQDGDGKVSVEEFQSGLRRFRRPQGKRGAPGADPSPPQTTTPTDKPRIAALDQDGNRKLSRNEYPGPDEAWRRFDRNQDGWITADELAGAESPRPQRGAGGTSPVQRIVQRDDRDGDGRVARAEFRGPHEVFDHLDRNKDGFLSGDDSVE